MADNPFAFPSGWPEHGIQPDYGMTLRDWFAGQAVGSVMHLCARDTLSPGETLEQSFARKAYAVADAMLAERERT